MSTLQPPQHSLAAPRGPLLPRLRNRFSELFEGADGLQVAEAPGRVNLIGEHTDYNEGWALPMAIDRHVAIAFRPRSDRTIRVHAEAFRETATLDIDQLDPPGDGRWDSLVAGVAWAMRSSGQTLSGIDCVIDGDLPIGAGLSSSAALEMAVARALCAASESPWVPTDMARAGQWAENEYLGINSGLMDQLISAAAEPGCALLLDFRTLETEAVPMPRDVKAVILDTGVRRSLGSSAYNERRASCDAAVEGLRQIDPAVHSLRDADLAALATARHLFDDVTFRRARHVIEENGRPAAMVRALRAGEHRVAGQLLNESHESLRDLFEVSSPELDLVTEAARHHSGCFGARMTGAGFGGCAVALVGTGAVSRFVDDMERALAGRLAQATSIFPCEAVAGARLVDAAETPKGALLR